MFVPVFAGQILGIAQRNICLLDFMRLSSFLSKIELVVATISSRPARRPTLLTSGVRFRQSLVRIQQVRPHSGAEFQNRSLTPEGPRRLRQTGT